MRKKIYTHSHPKKEFDRHSKSIYVVSKKIGDACQDTKARMCSLRRMPSASPISGSRKSGIAHIRFTDGPSITRPIRVRGENIPSEHVNYAPGQSPGHRPLASAEFHESLSRIYICLANANVEACLPACRPHSSSPASPLSPHPSLPMYNQFTVHRSCATISVNYCERLRRTMPTS